MENLCNESHLALERTKVASAGNKKITFVSGFFNILHPGHLRLLRFAKECGDFLVVGVLGDSQSRGQLLSESLRLEGILATSWVDFAFILRDRPEEFIRSFRPSVVVKGNEFANQINLELEIVNSYGGKLLFNSGDFSFSSIDLLRNEFKRLNFSDIEKPKDFPKRHGFTMLDLNRLLDKMKNINVLVIGDTVLDEYITCDPVGMSQEDPTIVVTPLFSETFLGAAGIVAAHAASLGGKVDFFSVVGEDKDADLARSLAEKYRVTGHFLEDPSRVTTRKQRFRANSKTLLRVNHLRQHEITIDLQKKIIHDLTPLLADKNLVIFSDFNYGCLPQALVDQIITLCRSHGIKIVADSQSSSQMGDVSRFHDMDLITPTEREARLAVQDFRSGIVVMAEALQKKCRPKNIFVTLGKEGIVIHADTSQNSWLTDRIPAMNTAPVDPAGGGDSLLVCSSLATSVGATIAESAYLGSVAAACQVGRLGNTPLTQDDLRWELLN